MIGGLLLILIVLVLTVCKAPGLFSFTNALVSWTWAAKNGFESFALECRNAASLEFLLPNCGLYLAYRLQKK